MDEQAETYKIGDNVTFRMEMSETFRIDVCGKIVAINQVDEKTILVIDPEEVDGYFYLDSRAKTLKKKWNSP